MEPSHVYKLQRLPLSDQVEDKVRLIFYLGVVLLSVIIAAVIGGRAGSAFLVGSVAALASHWYASRKCAMRLPQPCDVGAIRNAAYSLGYISIDRRGRRYRIGNLPRYLYFNHQDLEIRQLEKAQVLVGPVVTLMVVKRKLRR